MDHKVRKLLRKLVDPTAPMLFFALGIACLLVALLILSGVLVLTGHSDAISGALVFFTLLGFGWLLILFLVWSALVIGLSAVSNLLRKHHGQ